MPKRFRTPRPEPLGGTLDASERRRRQVIEGLRDAFVSMDAHWRITDCNARTEAILGRTRAELLGREMWGVIGLSPDSPLGEVARRVKQTGEPEEVEFTLHVNGAERLLNMRGFPLDDGVAVMSADITELRRAERRLAESEARFRELAAGVPAPLWMSGAGGTLEYINPAMLEALGLSEHQLKGDGWERHVHPESLPEVREALRKAQARHTRISYAVKVRRGDGAWRTLQVTGVPRFDAHGALCGHVGIATDITDLLAAEKRQKMLIDELNHRVRNTLATVQSIVRQTLKDGHTGKGVLELLNERLMALAAAHDILSRENWEGAELTEVAKNAVKPFDADDGRITIAGPEVRLDPSAALALFLAIHELATNATRHGALTAAGGRVTLSWESRNGAADLEWRESGGPPVRHPTRRGLGSRLLEAGLEAELGSPARIEYAPDGLVCRIHARLAA
jgi:PAS domain S-box-containing protein